jgi:hypothetical protein
MSQLPRPVHLLPRSRVRAERGCETIERISWTLGMFVVAGIGMAVLKATVGPIATLGIGGGMAALVILSVVVDERRTRARRLDAGEGLR